MQNEIRDQMPDGELKRQFEEMFQDGKLVRVADSVAKMIDEVLASSFTSGAHIDFYDNCHPIDRK